MISGPEQKSLSNHSRRLVIFLHGYGSNGEDLISLAPYFAQIDPDADFLSPNAPSPNLNLAMGFQWFPIPFMDGSSMEEMAKGLVNAQAALSEFIEAELKKRNLGHESLILVGFSQGTMMALHYALRAEPQIAAVIGFSGRLAFPELLKDETRSKPPIALVHGEFDDVLPFQHSLDAKKLLTEIGVEVSLHKSPRIAHTIAEDGLLFALNFYEKQIGKR